METRLAWHFSNGNNLRHGDKRKIVVGETLSVDEEKLDPCYYGLHASEHVYDALKYAPGTHLWRVELSGSKILEHSIDDKVDKLVAANRKVLAGGDAKFVLIKHAKLCALDVVHLWDAPDVAIKFLHSTDNAADAAARAAARDAADAARAAAAAYAARAAYAAAAAAAYAADVAAYDAAAAAAAYAAADVGAAYDAVGAVGAVTRAAYYAAGARAGAGNAARAEQRERLEKLALEWIETLNV